MKLESSLWEKYDLYLEVGSIRCTWNLGKYCIRSFNTHDQNIQYFNACAKVIELLFVTHTVSMDINVRHRYIKI